MSTVKYASREVRKEQIYRHVRTNPGATSYGIARALGLAPSGHLRNIIWELADEGRIRADVQAYRRNMVKFVYQAV